VRDGVHLAQFETLIAAVYLTYTRRATATKRATSSGPCRY